MCGILGILADRPIDRDLARRMRDEMRHRGPDGAGEMWFEGDAITLLHRRLAIIDLHPRAAQPMASDDGGQSIVFNGEIYNFRDLRDELVRHGYAFRTESDTEVILKAYELWGSSCVEKLNGMFAFAILDMNVGRLLLARDRAGEKPLFYLQHGPQFAFSSELKALLANPAFPRDVDAEALDCYLAFGYVPGSRCLLAGYRKLGAAHTLTLDLRSRAVAVHRYWQPPAVAPSGRREVELHSLAEELRGLLGDAVRRQLVADVPVGVLLSGGVDSSLVAALASRVTPHLKTFTIRFPGGALDESAHARSVAQHIGSEHTELDAEEQSVELLPELAAQYDEPMADSSAIPTFLVSKLTRRDCTVALGGDGGDELFGGYITYTRLLRLKRHIGWIPRPMRQAAAVVGLATAPRYARGRGLIRQIAADFERGLPDNAFLFDKAARRLVLSRLGSGVRPVEAEAVWAEGVAPNLPLLARALKKDFEVYLCDDLLVKVDRASMRNSLEVRAPFLDFRVIEFAFERVPPEFKVTSRSRKILLKEVARPLLPENFDFARKQGFRAPLQGWLESSGGRSIYREALEVGDSPLAGLGPRVVGRPGSNGWASRVYALVLLELWRRRYHVAF